MKKVLITIMCVVMVIAMMPAMAFAAEVGTDCSGNEACTHKAAIGNKHFDNVNDAITAATGNDTVKLLASIDSTVVIPAGKTVTLDINGKTVQCSGTAIINNGVLNLLDSIGSGKIKSTGNVAIGVGDNSTTTINSGNFEGQEGAVITSTSTGASIIINKGNFCAKDNAVIAGNGSNTKSDGTERVKPNNITINGGTFKGEIMTDGYVACGIYSPWKDNITVKDGVFNITKGAGIVARAGNIKVTGGTFNIGGESVTGKVGDSRVVVPCSAVVFDSQANYPGLNNATEMEINGGVFNTPNDRANIAFVKNEGDANKITVSGGTFSNTTSLAEFLPSGMEMKPGKDGTITIVDKADAVAKIGNAAYATLADAILAAKTSADVIDMVNNTQENVVVDKDIVLNLNGHTIANAEADGDHTITNKGELTINGVGTIDNTVHAKTALFNDQDAIVVLNGGKFTRSKETGASPDEGGTNTYYTILNRGNMTINNGVEVNQNGHFSSLIENGWFNGKDNESRKNSVLTINGGVFEGGINTIKNDEYGKLTIKGGTFNNTTQASVLNWNEATIEGGTFNSDKYAVLNGKYEEQTSNGSLTITGGSFKSKDTTIEKMSAGKSIGTININGGSFTSTNGSTLPKQSNLSGGTVSVSKGDFSDLEALNYLSQNLKKGDVQVTLPEGKNVEIPQNPNVNVIYVAKAGTTVTNKTNTTVTIKTPTGNYELKPQEVITSQNPIYIPVGPTTQKPAIEPNADVTTSLSTDGTKLTITAKEGFEIVDVTVNGVSKGAVTTVTGLKTGDKVVVVTKAIEKEPTAAEKKIAACKETKLIARSQAVKTKSGKKAIKITWKAKEGSLKNLDGVQIFRSTKRADGTYKKVFTSKSGKYINTSVKKGQMYYYKVRGYVRVDGKLYFTKYSTKAWRRV